MPREIAVAEHGVPTGIGQEPVDIVDNNGKLCLDGIQMEVNDDGKMIGMFWSKHRPTEVFKPGGEWPQHWDDNTHERYGHGDDAGTDDRTGEEILKGLIMSLYIQNGVEMACDDVSGATLDPGMVHAERKTEMDYFKDMVVCDRVPRSEQWETKGNITGTKWIDVNKVYFENLNIRSRLDGT